MVRCLWVLSLVNTLLVALPACAAPKPAVADKYLDLTVTYSIYAKTIWKEADTVGYWGDGLAPAPDKNGNGHVRGMANTMLGYALLIHAMDEKWLTDPQASLLQQAGLTRDELLRYIKLNLTYLIAHHASTPNARNPQWGFTWQSPLWIGGAGPAVLLVWKDLPDDLKSGFKNLTATEADRIAKKPPKSYKPGDTGAEENAWDSHAPAVALAIDPKHANAGEWITALKKYAVNVYSVPADKGSEFVSTTNSFADFTMENHGFFHPDYIQVSGQHLGEALLYLEMGDALHGTKLAPEFKPYAMHHLADVWEKVMRHLIQRDGEFAFPNGTDWTLRSSMTPSYLACIATLLGDPVAIEAEKVHPDYALRHRAVSPPGRVLGDTNLEWWWEPLLVKRSATALLQHVYRDGASKKSAPLAMPAPNGVVWPDAKAFAFRNDAYIVTASWGARHMGTFVPQIGSEPITLPIDGILPKEVEIFGQHKPTADVHTLNLRTKAGQSFYLVCLPNSVVWISPLPFRALGIQNDMLSGSKRAVAGANIEKSIQMQSDGSFPIPGAWANIDNRLGLISSSDSFKYTGPKGFNRKSAAYDEITPTGGDWGAWQMIAGVTQDQTLAIARDFSAERTGNTAKFHIRDGAGGPAYVIAADFTGDVSVWKEQ